MQALQHSVSGALTQGAIVAEAFVLQSFEFMVEIELSSFEIARNSRRHRDQECAAWKCWIRGREVEIDSAWNDEVMVEAEKGSRTLDTCLGKAILYH